MSVRPVRRRAPEVEFLVAAGWSVALVAVCSLPLAALLAGTAGLAGAGAGLGLLVALFGLSALLHVVAASFAARLWMAVTVGGFGFRLLLYFAALRVLGGLEGVSTLALGVTAAAGILVGQLFEMRALVRARSGAYVDWGVAPRQPEGVDR
jgi:hypothetical protein